LGIESCVTLYPQISVKAFSCFSQYTRTKLSTQEASKANSNIRD